MGASPPPGAGAAAAASEPLPPPPPSPLASSSETLECGGAALAAKRRALVAAGPQALHLILDYDRTMTTFFGPRGGRGDTCHGTVERRRSEELRARADALSAIFYPIEVDPARSREEKIPFMQQWYREVNELIVRSGMTRRDLAEDVARANIGLRRGVCEALDWAARHDVPVTVFSAGIGDVIEEVLRQRYRAVPHPRLRVVSNAMVWRSGAGAEAEEGGSAEPPPPPPPPPLSPLSPPPHPDDVVAGFSEPVLHPFNKFAGGVMGALPFFAELRARPHVLLLGDSPGDVTMADGLGCAHVLRVGFLNDAVEANIERFRGLFDVVVTHDGAADWVTRLLADIEAGAEASAGEGKGEGEGEGGGEGGRSGHGSV